MSQLQQFAYPYDPTGTNPENLILDERHVVSTVGSDYRLIVPKHGPYFKDSLIIKHAQTGAELTPGLDYTYSFYYEAASNTEPYPSIFGGISLLTSQYDGATLILEEYRTIGGEHVLSEESIATILANLLIDPRAARWDDVTYKPGVMTPSSHLTSLEETVGYGELVAAVERMGDNFNLETNTLLTLLRAHLVDTSDPHDVSPALLTRMQQIEQDMQRPLSYINTIESDMITLDGPTRIYQGETCQWSITNFDVFSRYSITSDFNSVSYADKVFTISAGQTEMPGNKEVILSKSGLTRTITMELLPRAVRAPSVTFTTQDAINVTAQPFLQSSSYSTIPDGVDTLKEIQWQFAMDANFNNLLDDTVVTENGALYSGQLPLETVVYVRCRHKGTLLPYSMWSTPIKFTTAGIEPPVVTITGKLFDPLDGEEMQRITHEFSISSSEYVGDGSHGASQFIVTDEDDNVIYDSGTVTNSLQLNVPFNNEATFESNTLYYILVRYQNDAGVWGPYSSRYLIMTCERKVTQYRVYYDDWDTESYTGNTWLRTAAPVGQTRWHWDSRDYPTGAEFVSVGSPYAGTPPRMVEMRTRWTGGGSQGNTAYTAYTQLSYSDCYIDQIYDWVYHTVPELKYTHFNTVRTSRLNNTITEL